MRFVDLADRIRQLAPPPVLDAVDGAAGLGNQIGVTFDHSGHLFTLIRVHDKYYLVMPH